jgi:hypothetical protein
MNDESQYFMQGRQNIETGSSVLVSSSKYLNSAILRDWISQEMLRRNGADYPATYAIPAVVQELLGLQDHARIEELFTKARKSWPELDSWFSSNHVSTYTKEDLARHAAGTVGHALHSYLESWGLELDLSTHTQFQGQYGYWMLRAGQQHDVEHILGGGGY